MCASHGQANSNCLSRCVVAPCFAKGPRPLPVFDRPKGLDKMTAVWSGSPARSRRNQWRATCLKLKHKLKTCLLPVLMHSMLSHKNGGVLETDAGSEGKRTAADQLCSTMKDFMDTSRLGCAVFFRKWWGHEPCSTSVGGARLRDLFPIPALREWPMQINSLAICQETCLSMSNMCIGALNFLNIGMKASVGPTVMRRSPSAAQLETQRHVCRRVVRFLLRFNASAGTHFAWRDSFEDCEAHAVPSCASIRSEAVDLPQVAATCDPCKLIHKELAHAVQDPTVIFPAGPSRMPVENVKADQRDEYVRLVVRELKCGKLRLAPKAHGLGGVFGVAKAGGRQRKIWNGSVLSGWAADPPRPYRLANPSSFLDVEIQRGEQIFFSKRDASTFFDSLSVPEELRTWFGQAPVTVQELLDAGLSFDNILAYKDGGDSLACKSVLFPVHTVWPMGFSWSSAVAQNTTVATCVAAGIDEDSILSPDYPLPSSYDEVCFVATDDTVLMHKTVGQGSRTLSNLDEAFDNHGIVRNRSKDVTLQGSVTALGCDLSNGPVTAEPNADKILKTVGRTLDVLHRGRASPRAFHGLLGVWEWFVLLQRSFFSIFDDVYSFVRRVPEQGIEQVPENAMNEILVTLLLAPLLAVSLDREPLQMLVSTDAAPEYGFGVSACNCDFKTASEVCRLAERRGDYVRLVPDREDPAEVARLGSPHRLPHTQRAFKTVVSAKAKWTAHSGVLEAHAYLLALRWLARQSGKHHRKIPFLIDAKAVIGAAAKGRSSARALRTILRAAASLCLASDILPRLVYIPSESNPADKPSRGLRNRPSGRPVRKSGGKTRVQQRLHQNLERLGKAESIIKRWI